MTIFIDFSLMNMPRSDTQRRQRPQLPESQSEPPSRAPHVPDFNWTLETVIGQLKDLQQKNENLEDANYNLALTIGQTQKHVNFLHETLDTIVLQMTRLQEKASGTCKRQPYVSRSLLLTITLHSLSSCPRGIISPSCSFYGSVRNDAK